MATQTQTIRRPVVNPSRVHDYLYDPVHFTSSERDHARATFKAHTSVSRVKKVPNDASMFSDLRHFPRFQVKLDGTDPVPKFISRQWQGYEDQARDALIRYKTFNYDPKVKIPHKTFPNAVVEGANRYKFFKKPIIPFMQQVPPDVFLASARQDPLAAAADAAKERAPTPLTRTVMVQTDYRDGEAQTDPYSPEYVVRPGSAPELLTLATLSWGKGLPAGLAEVEMIERARAKRAWEKTLPPLNDLSQHEKRRKMMDEQEVSEWALRESEIEKLQEARLEVLKDLLKQREVQHQELNSKRLDRLWARKQEGKEKRVEKIRHEHIRIIRKLTAEKKNVEGRLVRPDFMAKYTDFGSQAYAPLTRIGVFIDRGSEQYVVKNRYLGNFEGLLELEASLPDYVTNPRVTTPRPKTVTKDGFVKRKFRQENVLAEIHEYIKDKKTCDDEAMKPLKFLQKIEKPQTRPPTPAVEVPSVLNEEVELAVIFLQQLIRGRATQNMMYEGKQKRIELIKELRSTHALQEAEQLMKKQEMQATLALQRQRRLHEQTESFIDEGLSRVEGSSLGDMLDYLSKELIRLQEERRIHAFSMLAERQRRVREAEESGQRQFEERRRREEDEIFKQSVKVQQETVDTYLQDIIMNSVDTTAHSQAREEIQAMATKINDIAYEIENTKTSLESEEICADMVYNFLLPEVRKQTVREKVHMQQRKYLTAAHREIYKDGEEIISLNPRPTPEPEPSESSEEDSDEETTEDGEEEEDTKKKRKSESGTLPTSQGTVTSGTPTESTDKSRLQPSDTTAPTGSTTTGPTLSSLTTTDTTTLSTSRTEPSQSTVVSDGNNGNNNAATAPPVIPNENNNAVRTTPPVSSRRGSAASVKSNKSGRNTPSKSQKVELDLSIQGKGSRPASASSVKKGSKPTTPAGSKKGTPTGSKQVTPTGSRQATPTGSKHATPTGSKQATPVGSRQATPAGSKHATPVGSRSGTPVGSKHGSRPGSSHSNK